MGQYHKVYNVDKKQYIHGHRIDNGLKLFEQVGFPKSTADALFLLVANTNGDGGSFRHTMFGKWAGDRIVVQGDYADESSTAFISDTEEYVDISADVKAMLDQVFVPD